MAEPRKGAPRMVEPEMIASLRPPAEPAVQAEPVEPVQPPAPEVTESQTPRTESQLESAVPPEPEDALETAPEPAPEPGPEPPQVHQPARQPEPVPEREPQQPQTLSEMFARVDQGWSQFVRAAGAFPSERMDERLNDGWTRKQMLAHISAWHDLTHDRLGKLILTGESTALTENPDAINARVARQAIGRTAGETLKEMEMTFNRLRRQLGRLTDQQLAADDGWAANVIAANTYDHYAQHQADVYQPPPPDGRSGRR